MCRCSGSCISHCQNIASIAHSLIISGEGLILTLSILPCPQGRISWSTPCRKIDDERMSVLHQNSGVIGKSIPSALEISQYLHRLDGGQTQSNIQRLIINAQSFTKFTVQSQILKPFKYQILVEPCKPEVCRALHTKVISTVDAIQR